MLSMEHSKQEYSVTRWVLADKVKEIESKVSQWQKKAQQLGLEEPRIRFTGSEKIVQLPVYDLADKGDSTCPTIGIPDIPHVPALKKEVIFSGEIPKLEGYDLLAKIEHSRNDNGAYENLVFTPNKEAENSLHLQNKDFHICTPDCNHCDYNRDRKTTYMVENTDTNEVLQVGSTCVDDFFGKKTLKQIMASFDAYAFFFNSEEWEQMDVSYARNYNELKHAPVAMLLELADFYTVHQGFVRSGETNATKDCMLAALSLDKGEPSKALNIVRRGVSNVDGEYIPSEQVANIIEWAKTIENDEGNNYISNVQAICGRPFADIQQRGLLGLIASIPTAYQRYQATRKKINDNLPSLNEPFGVEKERGPLKLNFLKSAQKAVGPHNYTTYSFKDDYGRSFSWRASGSSSEMKAIRPGDTVEMDATIKGHSYFQPNKTHYTYLKICKNIVKVPADSPIPDFSAGAQKRAFKETFNFTPSHLDENGDNLGAGFMLVERTWRENSKIRNVKDVIPLNYTENYESHLVSIVMSAGVNRDPSDPYKEKKDKKFLAAAREAMRPFIEMPKPANSILYLVEGAYPPLFSGDPYAEGPLYGSVNEKSRSMPRFFLNEEEAISHGRKLPAGRLLKIQVPKWNPEVVPTSLLLSSEADVVKFKQQAKVDNNALVLMDEAGLIKRIEPLGMGSHWFGEGYNILRIQPVHSKPNESISSQSPHRLQGRKFATISGLENDHELSKALKSHISEFWSDFESIGDGIVYDIYSQGSMKGSLDARKTSASLQFLTSDIPMEAGKGRFLAVTDAVSQYYLSLLGADDISFHLVTPNTKSNPSQGSETIEVPDPSTISVPELVNEIKEKIFQREKEQKLELEGIKRPSL